MEGTEVEIRDVREVGPDTVALELDAPPLFDARPGQFVQLRAPVDGEPVTRHYSVSSPEATETFELTVGVDPEGSLTPRLAAATPGDAVEIDGPFGRAYYEGERAVTVLAAGPGIGAAVGIAERARIEGGDATVVYRTDDSANEDWTDDSANEDWTDDSANEDRTAPLVHEARLSRLAAAGALIFVIAGDEAFEAAVGDAVRRWQTRDGVDTGQTFVYGFAPFVTAAEAAFEAGGGDPTTAKVENFG